MYIKQNKKLEHRKNIEPYNIQLKLQQKPVQVNGLVYGLKNACSSGARILQQSCL